MIDILPSQDGDSDRAVPIHRLLEHLYRGDLDLARAVVNAARWDSGAETEELAYRFRSGRIADLGFVEYYDALRIYQEVDPKAAAGQDHRSDAQASRTARSRRCKGNGARWLPRCGKRSVGAACATARSAFVAVLPGDKRA